MSYLLKLLINNVMAPSLVYMDLNSYEHTGHYCKLVQQLKKHDDSQKCIANIIYDTSFLTAWCNAECKRGRIWLLKVPGNQQMSPLQVGEDNTELGPKT